MIKIILCAFNEAQNLIKLLPDINREVKKINSDYEITICIDGSNDESFALITQIKSDLGFFPIKILEPQNQRGLGFAYKRIFIDILKNSADEDFVISLDADNTHNPNQIGELIKICREKNLDLVIASRFCKTSIVKGFPLYRKFISKTTSLILQIIFPIKKISGGRVQDYSSGYRVYKVQKLKQLYQIHQDRFITEKDFIYTCEILLNMAELGLKVDEIPLIYDYSQKIGVSKMKIVKNSQGLLNLIMRYLAKKSFTSKK